MSGFSAGTGSAANGGSLDNLFAQLRQQQNRPINLEPSTNFYNNNNNNNFGQPSRHQQHHLPQGYEQPSISSPIPTPPVHTQPPHHSSAIMSPISDSPQPRIPSAIGGASNADRTSSLLNLLKFSQPSASSASQPAPIGTPALPVSRDTSASYNAAPEMLSSSYGRAASSQDLLVALMNTSQPKPHSSPQFTATPQPTASTFSASPNSPPADTQAYLLRLLNQPKPPQSDIQPQLEPAQESISPKDSESQGEVEELVQALEDASLDTNLMGSAAPEGNLETLEKREVSSVKESSPAPKVPQGIFTYVNPFDQLAASSPRNRTPKSTTPAPKPSTSGTPTFQILKRQVGEGADDKRKNDERSNVRSPSYQKRKRETSSDVSSASPTPLADGRSLLEAMIGIDAKETVAEAVSELGHQVDKQVEQAIAEAEQGESQAAIEKNIDNLMLAETEKEVEGAAQVAASATKELEKEENSGALDDLPTPLAEAVKDIVDETAHGHVADSWESADAEDGPENDEVRSPVKVFNFPMKPFITITVNANEEPGPFFRSEAVIDIARLKKEFDQIDRTLVTATSKFIVYAMSKNGGIRIIRQEDGKDSKLFTDTKERIFNVATSTGDMKETIIATGINGTVYWATIKDGDGDYIEDSHPETHGFVLPPLQTHEQESPGGVLKTRARKSSTHPDFFAVGRGKSIHIIWPSIIMKQAYLKDGKERIVDTEKYLSHRSLKVNTGKAGKDFTFSEDDTTIASLDKAGRVKFWDVRSLTKTTADMRFPSPEQIKPIEIKEPLLTFITTPATEKSWPTSVLFVDKLRPYQRGGALRYLIVGMKQNHTLQLWDLGLSKPVQEIHLPHTKESDAMCSVLYHAASGMIIVGHPTRNSIYFFHLSAPKYSLPRSLTQAEYIEKLVANDPSIPKPDSTAVLSGMREYSFANKGNLRSLDILQNPETVPAGEDPTLFELYAMHSKGVTCLSLKQLDMGWSLDNKVIEPFAAEKCDAIAITALKDVLPPVIPEKDLPPSVPQSPAPAHRIIQRPAGKESTKKMPAEATSAVPSKAEEKVEKKDFAPAPNGQTAVGGGEKSEKKKRRKATQSSSGEAPAATAQSSKNAQAESSLSPMKNGPSVKTTPEAATSANHSEDSIEGSFKNIETRIAGQFKKLLGDSMDNLNRNIKDDRRTQAAVSEAKQDAMLRLVSTTLSENVEGTLGRIISTSIKQSVLPVISDVTSKAVNEQLGSKLNMSINNSFPKELQKLLPDAIAKALQQPQLQKSMADSLAKSVAFRVEETFANLLQKTITPAFSTLAVQASQRVAADIQRQASEQIGSMERQRQADSLKIEQLTQVVSGLTEMVATMAAAQSEFQGQFLKMQQQSTRDRDSSLRPETALVTPEKTREQLEQEEFDVMLESINVAMNEGNYEDAIIRWLQTGREQEFFANFFSKFNPAFIRELNPLMLLSVGATVSIELEGPLLMERVAWLEVILSALTAAISTMEDHVRELIPKIMSIYTQRLEHLFMCISNVAAQDPILKRLSLLVSASNRLLESSNRSSMIPRAPSAASSARATPHILGNHRGSTSGRGLGL